LLLQQGDDIGEQLSVAIRLNEKLMTAVKSNLNGGFGCGGRIGEFDGDEGGLCFGDAVKRGRKASLPPGELRFAEALLRAESTNTHSAVSPSLQHLLPVRVLVFVDSISSCHARLLFERKGLASA